MTKLTNERRLYVADSVVNATFIPAEEEAIMVSISQVMYAEIVRSGPKALHLLLGTLPDHPAKLSSYREPTRSLGSWGQLLAAQIDAAKKLRAKEDALRAELSAFLNSVKTYKQVIEKMPELERHLPVPPQKAMPLVVSTANLASQLGKLGFDRSAPEVV